MLDPAHDAPPPFILAAPTPAAEVLDNAYGGAMARVEARRWARNAAAADGKGGGSGVDEGENGKFFFLKKTNLGRQIIYDN